MRVWIFHRWLRVRLSAVEMPQVVAPVVSLRSHSRVGEADEGPKSVAAQVSLPAASLTGNSGGLLQVETEQSSQQQG